MGTPTEDIIAKANVTATVQDTANRSIVIRKMQAVDRMRLAELVGAENVKNDLYYGYASLAYHVQSIDGVRCINNSKASLEATVKMLGDEGLVAVGNGIAKEFQDAPLTEDEAKDALKN